MNGAPVGRIISSTGLTPNPVISGIDSSALHDSGFGGSFISSTGRGSFGGSSISGGSSQSGGSNSGGMNGYPLPPLPTTPNMKQFDPVSHQFTRGSPTNHHQQYHPQHPPQNHPQHPPQNRPQHPPQNHPQHHPQNHPQHHPQNHPQHHPQNHPQHHPQNHPQHHPQNHPQHHTPPPHMSHFHHTAPQYPMPSHIQSGVPPPLPPYNHFNQEMKHLPPTHPQMTQQELPPDISTHHQLHARSSGSGVRRSSVSSQDLALRNVIPQEFSGGDCKQNLPINNNISSSNKVFDTIDLLQSANHKHSTDDEILREAFMVKRSQNKSRFGPTNWRERWFVLTPAHLIYFDGDKQSGRKKEKGRVDLSSVEYVERVDDNVFDRQHVIQIAHILSCSESGPQTINCTLYIEATTQLDATSWMQHIRTLIANNSSLSSHYHPGRPQRGASWACCKSATPCTPITWSPSNQPLGPCLSPPTPQLRGGHPPGEIVKHQRQQSSTSSHCSILTINSAASPPPSLALSVDMIGGSLAALDTGMYNHTL